VLVEGVVVVLEVVVTGVEVIELIEKDNVEELGVFEGCTPLISP
jgi:hypothetical protein